MRFGLQRLAEASGFEYLDTAAEREQPLTEFAAGPQPQGEEGVAVLVSHLGLAVVQFVGTQTAGDGGGDFEPDVFGGDVFVDQGAIDAEEELLDVEIGVALEGLFLQFAVVYAVERKAAVGFAGVVAADEVPAMVEAFEGVRHEVVAGDGLGCGVGVEGEADFALLAQGLDQERQR